MPAKPSPVINSSPLIALCAALADLDLLGCIVERLIVPSEVLDELAAAGLRDDTAARVKASTCCKIVPVRGSGHS